MKKIPFSIIIVQDILTYFDIVSCPCVYIILKYYYFVLFCFDIIVLLGHLTHLSSHSAYERVFMALLTGKIFPCCVSRKSSRSENENTMMTNVATVASYIYRWGCVCWSQESPSSFTDNTVTGRYWRRVVTDTALILRGRVQAVLDDPGKSKQIPEALQGWGLSNGGKPKDPNRESSS